MKTSHSIQKIIKDNKHTHAFIKIHVITSVILVLFKYFVIVFINILNYHPFSPLRSPHAGFCFIFPCTDNYVLVPTNYQTIKEFSLMTLKSCGFSFGKQHVSSGCKNTDGCGFESQRRWCVQSCCP